MIEVKVNKSAITANVSPKGVKVNNDNVKVVKGDTGAVYIPHVDSKCNLSWSNNGGLENPPTVCIKGDNGDATVTRLTNMDIEEILGR